MNLEGGRLFDESCGLIFPWYTKPFIDKLKTWDLPNWRVFEYGCGDSTIWWRYHVKEVLSVDTNLEWANKTGSIFIKDKTDFINSPIKYCDNQKFDCIIIDSEPVDWRDECIPVAMNCLENGGYLIIDNYNQKTVNLEHWPNVNNLLKDLPHEVFKQDGHVDWKTAYWIKS